MRGCMRKIGIALGVLALLVAVLALVFWLNWRRGNQLSRDAWDAYYNKGDPVQALASYQAHLKTWGLDERQVRLTQDKIDELEGYLNAARLQQAGQVDEAVAAYRAFLEDHLAWKTGYNPLCTPYYYRASQALATLQPQQAQQHHERGSFGQALDVYESVLALETLVGDQCPQESAFDSAIRQVRQEAEAAIQESRAAALAAMPVVLLDWAQALAQGESVAVFIKRCERVLQEHPEILRTERGPAARAALDEARAELPAWLEANPAVPALDFPQEVKREGDTWVLITRFRETGGMVGYTLRASGWILDVEGNKWMTWGLSEIKRGPVTVPASGEAENTYRFSGDPFVDGYAVFAWEGSDEGGHPIVVEERVHLLP
jgi:tetratricopeptide (TPR) repeat protein